MSELPDPQGSGIAAIDAMAREAGALLRSRFGDPGTITGKGVANDDDRVHDVVTELDFACERLLLDRIREVAPSAAVLAEEGGATTMDGAPIVGSIGEADDLWVVDPLDGTINFAHGLPMFCVSIGRYRGGRPVAGVIHAPMLDETWSFAVGDAARLDGVPLPRLEDVHPNDALLSAGGAGPRFRELARSFRTWRRVGSAALSLAWVASGRFGAYVQTGNLFPWDFAAGAPLIEAAGGRLSTDRLDPWHHAERLGGPSGIVCGNPLAYDTIAELMRAR